MKHRFQVAARKLTRNIDIFGSSASLYISGEPTYKTSTGGCFSILFVISIIAYMYYAFKGLLEKKTFTYTYTETFIEYPQQLNITNPTLYLAVMVLVNETFQNLTAGGASYLNIMINQVNCPQDSKNCTTINLGGQPCQQSLFPTYPNFNQFVEGGFCPQDNSYVLSGQPLGDLYDGIESTYIEIIVTDCNDTTVTNSSIKCAPNVNTSNTEFVVYVFYTNNYIDVNNYANPLQQLTGYAGGPISPGFIEMVYTEYIDELSITTNEGYITAVQTQNISYSIDPLSEVVLGRAPTGNNTYMLMNLRRSQLASVYTRQYLTLSAVMSEIGGLAISMRKILGLVVAAYASMKYKVLFTNSIYAFKGIIKVGKKEDIRRQSTLTSNIDKVNEKEYMMIALNGSTKIGEFLLKAAVPRHGNVGRINAGFWDFIKANIPCGFRKTEKGKMITKAEENIIRDTSILNIVRTFREVERLEQIVLNKEETLLFETMHDPFSKEHVRKLTVVADGPPLFLNDFPRTDPFYRDLNTRDLEGINDLYQAWYKMETNPNKSHKEIKLLEMMDPDVLEMLQIFKKIVGNKFETLPGIMVKSIKKLKANMEIASKT